MNIRNLIRNKWPYAAILLALLFFPKSNLVKSEVYSSKEMFRIATRLSTMGDSNAFDPRSDRWDYTQNLFDSYPIANKFFGGGFDYLPKFANLYLGGKVGEDYPHNFILSTLLYNGILGVVLYLLLIGQVLWSYLRRYSKHKVFFFFFLYFMIVVSTSSNSLFSNWICTPLLLIPLLHFNTVPFRKKMKRA